MTTFGWTGLAMFLLIAIAGAVALIRQRQRIEKDRKKRMASARISQLDVFELPEQLRTIPPPPPSPPTKNDISF